MKLIDRHYLLDALKSMRCTPDLKIITGLRRSGKSKLLAAYIDYLHQEDADGNIIFVALLYHNNLCLFTNLWSTGL